MNGIFAGILMGLIVGPGISILYASVTSSRGDRSYGRGNEDGREVRWIWVQFVISLSAMVALFILSDESLKATQGTWITFLAMNHIYGIFGHRPAQMRYPWWT